MKVRTFCPLLLAFGLGLACAQTLNDWISASCDDCVERMATESGAYILEKGEDLNLLSVPLNQ